ncbi:MAG TPA: hypothetical protein VN894_17090 [Polyangiaceae bacterium]|nr:hypothetical protein [Polyangiaceae bacterium]
MRARWAWAIIGVAACSVRSPCTGRGTSAVADRACADWATHYCNRLESCAPLTVQIGYGDVAQCIERNKPVCASVLGASGTGQTPGHIASCAQAYDSASCEEVVVAKPPLPCAVQGSLPIGAACGDDSQCSGPSGYCRMANDETCGTCSVLGPVGAGCYSDRDCEHGLVCYFTCTSPVALGAACDGMKRQCPATLVCFDYTCRAPAPSGATCDPRADSCDRDHGLFCDPQTKSCSPFTLAEAGAPCGAGTACKAGSCATDPSTQKSTCVANAADGATCDATSGPFCMAPARCVDAACKIPDAAGCR